MNAVPTNMEVTAYDITDHFCGGLMGFWWGWAIKQV